MATAWVRVRAFSRSHALRTWVRTVSGLIERRLPDLLVREAVGDVREHFRSRAASSAGLVETAPSATRAKRGVDVPPTRADRLERLTEIGERRVLEDERVRPGLEDGDERCSDPDRRCKRQRASPGSTRVSCSTSSTPPQARHAVVDEGEVGPRFLRTGDRGRAVRGRATTSKPSVSSTAETAATSAGWSSATRQRSVLPAPEGSGAAAAGSDITVGIGGGLPGLKSPASAEVHDSLRDANESAGEFGLRVFGSDESSENDTDRDSGREGCASRSSLEPRCPPPQAKSRKPGSNEERPRPKHAPEA